MLEKLACSSCPFLLLFIDGGNGGFVELECAAGKSLAFSSLTFLFGEVESLEVVLISTGHSNQIGCGK